MGAPGSVILGGSLVIGRLTIVRYRPAYSPLPSSLEHVLGCPVAQFRDLAASPFPGGPVAAALIRVGCSRSGPNAACVDAVQTWSWCMIPWWSTAPGPRFVQNLYEFRAKFLQISKKAKPQQKLTQIRVNSWMREFCKFVLRSR